MDTNFHEPVAFIVNARTEWKKIHSDSYTEFKKSVNRIMHNTQFVNYFCLTYTNCNRSISKTLQELNKVEKFYLDGKRAFNPDDMIEFKAAIKYLIEYSAKLECA